MRIKRINRLSIFAISLFLFSQSWGAEVLAVPNDAHCFLCGSSPTKTMYWQSKKPRALLIYLPGGDGHFGLSNQQTRVYSKFVNYLASLSNPNLTNGVIDFVLLDSPEPLSPNQIYPTARNTEDHLQRIEAVMTFYKNKTGLPIWLLGHSAGGISLTHFIEFEQKKGGTGLISGVIASSVRNESYVDPPIDFPILIIHHAEDGCYLTNPKYAKKLFDSLKDKSHQPLEFELVSGGEPEGDPCTSGFHVFNGVEPLFVKEIEFFMMNNSR